jgi:hypothetical protein
VLRLSRGALLNCILARPDAGEAVNEMEGFVDWLVDKVIKNCLDMMWRIRESVGQMKVAAGQLVVAPSRSERTADLLARQEMTRGMTVDVMLRFRRRPSRLGSWLAVRGRLGGRVILHEARSASRGARLTFLWKIYVAAGSGLDGRRHHGHQSLGHCILHNCIHSISC